MLKYLSFLQDLDVIIKALSSSLLGLLFVLGFMLVFIFYFAAAGTLLFKFTDPFSFRTVSQRFDCLELI